MGQFSEFKPPRGAATQGRQAVVRLEPRDAPARPGAAGRGRRLYGRLLFMKLLSSLMSLLILGASSSAGAVDVPFTERAGVVRAANEATALTAAGRANLTESRLQPAVVRATV